MTRDYNWCLDLIRGAKHVLSASQYAQFGTFEEAKEELMAMERVLLQTIKFDFHVEHAHKYIIQVYIIFNFNILFKHF